MLNRLENKMGTFALLLLRRPDYATNLGTDRAAALRSRRANARRAAGKDRNPALWHVPLRMGEFTKTINPEHLLPLSRQKAQSEGYGRIAASGGGTQAGRSILRNGCARSSSSSALSHSYLLFRSREPIHESWMRENCTSSLSGGRRPALQGRLLRPDRLQSVRLVRHSVPKGGPTALTLMRTNPSALNLVDPLSAQG